MLYGGIYYSRVSYIIRMYTLEQGHIIRYMDMDTRAGSQYTLYGFSH
jgi:hypothetical protein